MLVLSRFIDERLFIGKDVVITVVDIRKKAGRLCVRFGIEAPREIQICRDDAIETTPRNRAEAATEESPDKEAEA